MATARSDFLKFVGNAMILVDDELATLVNLAVRADHLTDFVETFYRSLANVFGAKRGS